MKEIHEDFTIQQCGLIINPKYPHLGASPDALSSCKCHGKGCVEVKCPFCIKDITISEAISKGVSICLEQSLDRLTLKRNHPYWYQVQLQLGVSKLPHADFVVWTTKDIHIERIEANDEFIESQLKVASDVYISGILPELLAKYHTRNHTNSKVVNGSEEEIFCYCRCTSEESLVLCCGNEQCTFKKFHLKCCGLVRKPSSKKTWHCVDCRKLRVSSTSDTDRQG